MTSVSDCLQRDPKRCGGKFVLKDTRFTLAQLLAELADGDRNLKEICEDFELDFDIASKAVHCSANAMTSTQKELEGILNA